MNVFHTPDDRFDAWRALLLRRIGEKQQWKQARAGVPDNRRRQTKT